MRRRFLALALLAVGLGLMLNPLYLPVTVAEPTDGYVHNVGPVDAGIPEYTAADVVAYEELPADGRQAFDEALATSENAYVVDDPEDRVDGFDYPTSPALGNGLTIVELEGAEYALWTYTVEREPTVVVTQRVVVQPALFLLGFFAVVGAVALEWNVRRRGAG